VVPGILVVHWKFSMCTATRTSSYSPVGPSVFCVFSLGLCFMCSFVLFDLFVCPHSFIFPWALESSPLRFLALVVTNLNEPPRALAASTIMWVRS